MFAEKMKELQRQKHMLTGAEMRLEVEKAGFAYPGGRSLFKDLSFVLEEQTILTVLGRNGVGKTTLLKCIMGILHFSEGVLLIDGRKVPSALHEKGIAYVPQAHDIPFAYTVRDIVTMGRARYIGAPFFAYVFWRMGSDN